MHTISQKIFISLSAQVSNVTRSLLYSFLSSVMIAELCSLVSIINATNMLFISYYRTSNFLKNYEILTQIGRHFSFFHVLPLFPCSWFSNYMIVFLISRVWINHQYCKISASYHYKEIFLLKSRLQEINVQMKSLCLKTG